MADIVDSSSHTRNRKARLEPVVFLTLRNRWADINPPQYFPEKERRRDGGEMAEQVLLSRTVR